MASMIGNKISIEGGLIGEADGVGSNMCSERRTVTMRAAAADGGDSKETIIRAGFRSERRPWICGGNDRNWLSRRD